MKKTHFIVSLALLAAAVAMIVAGSPVNSVFQNLSFDAFQQLQPREFKPAPVRIIDIDEESLQKCGQWPWPRVLLADLVKRLTAMDAAAVAFDMVFAEPDRMSPRSLARYWPDDPDLSGILGKYHDFDRQFADAIARGRVVAGFSCSSQQAGNGRGLPELKTGFVTAGDDPRQFLAPSRSAIRNLPAIEAAAAGNGAFNYLADRDGLIRHVPLVFRVNNDLYPSLAAEALRVAQGAGSIVVKSSGASGEERFGGHTGIVSVRIGALPVRTDSAGEVWFHYSPTRPERYIPAWKVLSGEVEPSAVAGNILFLGTSAKGLLDMKVSPLGEVIPGVEIHAQLVEQLINNDYLTHPDWSAAAAVLFLVAGWLVLAFTVSRSSAFLLALTAAGLIGVAAGGTWFAFTRYKYFLDPLFPSITIAVMYGAGGFLRFMETERKRRWIQSAFSSYISPNLVSHLVEHPEQLKLGGEKRECSFVLTDLAGFTTFMEQADPAQVVGLLNAYIDEMLKIAFRHDATIDRIVGDAIALIFSAPVVQEDHAARAVACALELDEFAVRFTEEKRNQGIALGGTRIGVHTGTVIIGNFGGKTMFDYRALGDPINTCSRLETVNKQLGTRVCVSRETVDRCPGFTGRPVGNLLLKGKTQGIEAYEPLRQEDLDSPGIRAYLAAYDLMRASDVRAKDAFASLVGAFPSDPLAGFHLGRLEKGATGDLVILESK